MIKIDRSLLEAHSRAEISRREISDRLGEEVSFGDLLAALHAEGLPRGRSPHGAHGFSNEILV